MKTANRRQTHRSFQNRETRPLVAVLGPSEATGPKADEPRLASHWRDDDSRPKGTPNRDCQSTETTAVVSVPCARVFDEQDIGYQRTVLGDTRARGGRSSRPDELGSISRLPWPLCRNGRLRQVWKNSATFTRNHAS